MDLDANKPGIIFKYDSDTWDIKSYSERCYVHCWLYTFILKLPTYAISAYYHFYQSNTYQNLTILGLGL
jgi:hypothetical protein